MAGPNGSIQGPAEAKWGYTTLSVADWDGDGLPDLIVNSIWGKVVWFKNIGTRTAPKLAAAQPIEVEWDGPQPRSRGAGCGPNGKALLTQWRTTPVAVDWNKDGLMDLVMLDQEGYLAFFERAKRDGKLVLLPPKRVLCGDTLLPTDPPTRFVQAAPGQAAVDEQEARGRQRAAQALRRRLGWRRAARFPGERGQRRIPAADREA
jgi:hypothetical protein